MGDEGLLPPASSVSGASVVADRYVLERSVGNGGMGEVFVATDRTLGRQVALKQLSPTLVEDADARARFFREARLLDRISDPNVVAIFDVGEEEDRPFLVMEFIQGTTVAHELETLGRLPTDRVSAIGAGIAGGLAAAHAKGVVHRDVKPSNIFLTGSDQPKVGDFGIARLERGDKTLTLDGAAFGSPAYIAPEQAMGRPVDARADLYALGCVLYHLLAGRLPFEGDEPLALTYQHVHSEPVRLDALDAGVPPALASLVANLMEKDPADRPRSAEAVRRALEGAHDAGRTLVAPVSSSIHDTAILPAGAGAPPDRRRRWPWPIAAIAGAAVLLAVLMALAIARWGGQAGEARRSPSVRATSTAPAVSPTVATLQPPSTPQEAATALVTLARAMEASGAIDKHLADDIEHGAEDLLKHADEPDDVAHRLSDLRKKVFDAVEHATVTQEDAQRLLQGIDQLGATLRGGESEGD
jgi:hypothetical protein